MSPDTKTLAALFTAHGPRIQRRARRLLGDPADAEEATQEVFIRVLSSAAAFEGRSAIATWLHEITTNYCLNLLRDRARRAELHAEHLTLSAGLHGEVAPTRADERIFLQRLLAAADELEAQAAVYVYLDGRSHGEAAELLGVSRRTVGNLLERLRAWAVVQAGSTTSIVQQACTTATRCTTLTREAAVRTAS